MSFVNVGLRKAKRERKREIETSNSKFMSCCYYVVIKYIILNDFSRDGCFANPYCRALLEISPNSRYRQKTGNSFSSAIFIL